MSHALDNTYLKLQRARKHLTDLKERIEDFRKPHTDVVTLKPHPSLPSALVFDTARINRELSLIVGDIADNLRAALNYLVYQLAAHDTGGHPDKSVQFPIDEAKQDFGGHVKRFLKGIRVEHIALIERLQPYNGNNWLRQLRELSNPNKHTDLVRVRAKGRHTLHRPTIISAKSDDYWVLRRAIPVPFPPSTIYVPKTMNVDYRIIGEVTFSDGTTPVVEGDTPSAGYARA